MDKNHPTGRCLLARERMVPTLLHSCSDSIHGHTQLHPGRTQLHPPRASQECVPNRYAPRTSLPPFFFPLLKWPISKKLFLTLLVKSMLLTLSSVISPFLHSVYSSNIWQTFTSSAWARISSPWGERRAAYFIFCASPGLRALCGLLQIYIKCWLRAGTSPQLEGGTHAILLWSPGAKLSGRGQFRHLLNCPVQLLLTNGGVQPVQKGQPAAFVLLSR